MKTSEINNIISLIVEIASDVNNSMQLNILKHREEILRQIDNISDKDVREHVDILINKCLIQLR